MEIWLVVLVVVAVLFMIALLTERSKRYQSDLSFHHKTHRSQTVDEAAAQFADVPGPGGSG